MMAWLDRRFRLAENRTSVRTEVLAGCTTFLTMAYIVFVNPVILGAAGMDRGAVMVATCLGSAFATALMGFLTNYPVALAPAMGHNAFFAFTVCGAMGFTWPQALAANLVSGSLFTLLVLLGASRAFVDVVPRSLQHAIAVGIGLLLAMIGLQWGGLVKGDPATLVTLGDLGSAPVLVSTVGFLVMSALWVRKVGGAILLGMLAALAVALVSGVARFEGVVSRPPSLAPTFLAFDFSTAARGWVEFAAVVFVLLFLDVFDTVGTLLGVATQGGFLRNGRLERVNEAFFSDAVGTVAGVCLGTSTVSSYVESGAGISQGGRTGLTAIVVALLFLAAVFFSPLVQTMSAAVPTEGGLVLYPVIAPALLLVAVFMMQGVRHVAWDDLTEAIPAFLTLVIMPLTFSITEGIAFGFLGYAALKAVAGRAREVPRLLWPLAALFLLFLGVRTRLAG
ncbi:MAG: NCS2 family permease [Planctomycetota bacterium]